MNTLQITGSMPLGHPGEDSDTQNPIARALSRLFLDGQPFERMCHCYFQPEPGNLRWLGVFVHSAGDRVLFFPGFVSSFTKIQAFKATRETWNQEFLFDHASLERDRRTWHVTSPRSRQHLGRPSTLDIGEGSVLWFGMSVANSTVLRPAHQQTTVNALVPPSDSKRRADVFKSAREGAQFVMPTMK